jgi:hypothetical protein
MLHPEGSSGGISLPHILLDHHVLDHHKKHHPLLDQPALLNFVTALPPCPILARPFWLFDAAVGQQQQFPDHAD